MPLAFHHGLEKNINRPTKATPAEADIEVEIEGGWWKCHAMRRTQVAVLEMAEQVL